MHTALKNLWACVAIEAGAVLDRDRLGAGDLALETSGLRPAERSWPSDLTLAGLSVLTSTATSVMRPCIPQPAAASQIRAPCLRFLTPAAAANEPKVDKRGAVAAANSAAKAASAAEQWTAKCAQATSAVSLDLEQSLAKTAEQAQVQSELSALEAQAQRAAPTEGQGGEVEDDEEEIFDEEDEDDDEA
eukprot:jgi/Tetstr1/456848/TSEL_043520.t1